MIPSLMGGGAHPQAVAEPALTKTQRVQQRFALAKSLEQISQWPQAEKAYQELLQEDPRHVGAHHRLAIVLDRQGHGDQADEHYQFALLDQPRNADLLCDYGYSLYLRKQFGPAEQQLRKACELQPSLARAQNTLGLVLARTNRADEAFAAFTRAGNSTSDARANVAYALMLDNHWHDAETQLRTALSQDPQSERLNNRWNELQAIVRRTRGVPQNILQASYEMK